MTALAMFAAPTLASAQTCASLNRRMNSLAEQMFQQINDEPGAAIVINTCYAAAQGSYDQDHDSASAVAGFAVCAILGCSLFGDGKCTSVMSDWLPLRLRYEDLQRQAAELGCDQ